MKIAVILFNLGGPDAPQAIEPFLINLFSDPAIIGLPQPFRGILAKFLGKRRARTAREIYDKLGGGSPLLANTQAQAEKLNLELNQLFSGTENQAKIFIAMRYWHPMTEETTAAVKDYAPDKIILLPLYPHYSTTTSGSSIAAWQKQAKKIGLNTPTQIICCYPLLIGLVEGMANLIKPIYEESQKLGATKLLFSAHGLPKKIVKGGDPYQWQIEQSAATIAQKLAQSGVNLTPSDWQVCYQSRVGPLEWIGPATEQEIIAAGQKGQNIVLCPIAFVSEHSETLVELDMEYRHLAENNGVPHYFRVPTLSVHPLFINGLAEMVNDAAQKNTVFGITSNEQKRLCPTEFCRCTTAQA